MENADREIEIKLAVLDTVTRTRRRLREAGLRVFKGRVFEDNIILDTPALRLRMSRELIRIRRAGKSSVLTYKGPSQPGRHKSREEIETRVDDPDRLERIFAKLGYSAMFRYQKFRTEYRTPGQSGTVTLDETPIGVFLEIEGSPRWIDRMARKLAYSPSDYITLSYGALYAAYCRKHGQPAGNMVFE